MASPLISTEELAAKLGDPGLRILDASWHLDGRDGRAEFDAAHVPGARFLDLDAVSDQHSDLPHMLPSPAAFAASMGVLGVSDRDEIVVYDAAGLFSAARAWWMLRTLGARHVRVLDGGLPKWIVEGRETTSGPTATDGFAVFSPVAAGEAVATREDVSRALAGAAQVVDARGAARFRGEQAEPRPGVQPGHMPGAINLPYSRLLTPDGTLKRGEELVRAFTETGVDPSRPTVTTCGSGVTAAILTLGLAELGYETRLYDGSWAEWGALPDAPIATD